MKHIYKSLAFVAGMALLQSCENDLEKAYYMDSQAKPAVLENISENITINNLDPEGTVLTFKWTPAGVGYNASITNSIEMDIAGENNFTDKQVILYSNSSKGTTVSLGNKELNDQIISLLKKYADENGNYTLGPTSLQFRISSSISSSKNALISNIVSSTVTPYDNSSTGYKKPVITTTGITDINLNAESADKTALSLAWDAAYLGDNASITYDIEINIDDDDASYEIYKTKVTTVKNSNSVDISYGMLNEAVQKLLEKYSQTIGAGIKIKLYVSATKSNHPIAYLSNELSINITE